MATRHKQQLADYLASHKNASSASKRSVGAQSTKTSQGARSKPTSSGPRQGSVTSSARGPATSRHLQNRTTAQGRKIKTSGIDGCLPDEILLKIFTYLDVVSLLQASQVNKRWCGVTKDDSLWKSIAQRYASTEKSSNDGAKHRNENQATSFQTQWRNVCIARCAKWRNQRALKLLKKSPLNPFTGLPRDTEKALKEISLTYQLSLVDSYSKECCTESCRVSYQRSSVAVTWHSLHFMHIRQVRRLRLLAICPLFYNEGGKVVKGSPYQRSLLWETDIKLTDWTTEKQCVGADDLVTMYKLPGDLLMATWKADGEVAFFVAGLHYHQLVQRCLLGTPTKCYTPLQHKVVPDDIDKTYGLHDYKATVELRSFRQTFWSQQFSGLHCRLHDLALGTAVFTLIRHDNAVDHTPLEKKLGLPWGTELFTGNVQNAAWLDVTVLDERGEVFFVSSSPVKADKPSIKEFENEMKAFQLYKPTGADLEYEESEHLVVKHEEERATVIMEIGKLDYGKAFVRHLQLGIKGTAINDWFGTKYLTNSPVKADKPSIKEFENEMKAFQLYKPTGADLEYEESEHLVVKHEEERATVIMEIGKSIQMKVRDQPATTPSSRGGRRPQLKGSKNKVPQGPQTGPHHYAIFTGRGLRHPCYNLDKKKGATSVTSSPVKADKPSIKGADLEYEESEHLVVKHEEERATVIMEIGKLDYGKAFVRHLQLGIKGTAINDWFGTKYLTK